MNYNIQQINFIKNPLENCKLLGIPGGGKTQSIIGKIIHHFENGDFKTNSDFLILTFSRRACNDFIEKGHKQNKKYFNTKNIKTLHSLAGKIVYHILEKRSSSQDTIIISCLDLLDKLDKLDIPEFKNLKVIFIDEAQDISKIQFQLIQKIAQLTNSYIILIGDPNQNIYQFQNGSDEFLINHPGKTFHLTINYRSTKPIVDFINHFRPWTHITQLMESGLETNILNTNKPTIVCDSTENIIKDVINKILNSPYPKEEIAIIGPVKKSKPYNDVYTNIGLSLFTNLLNQFNIPYIKQYEDGTGEGSSSDNNKTDFKKSPNHINILTVHGSKGLEFKQVFLLNFHTSTFGMMPTEEKYKEFKYLWYVGLSRASYDLNIYIEKSRLPWYELKNCPRVLYNLYNFNNLHDNTSLSLTTLFSKELNFKDEIKPMTYSVTEILNSKKYCDDEAMYALERLFPYTIESTPLYENSPSQTSIINKDFAALYGIYMENIFN